MEYNKALHSSINRNNLSEALGTMRSHCKRLSGRSWWVMEGSADSVKQQAVNGAINTLFIIMNVRCSKQDTTKQSDLIGK